MQITRDELVFRLNRNRDFPDVNDKLYNQPGKKTLLRTDKLLVFHW